MQADAAAAARCRRYGRSDARSPARPRSSRDPRHRCCRRPSASSRGPAAHRSVSVIVKPAVPKPLTSTVAAPAVPAHRTRASDTAAGTDEKRIDTPDEKIQVEGHRWRQAAHLPHRRFGIQGIRARFRRFRLRATSSREILFREIAVIELEDRDAFEQATRLILESARGIRRTRPSAMRCAEWPGIHLAHEDGHALDAAVDVVHRGAGLGHELRACLDLVARCPE